MALEALLGRKRQDVLQAHICLRTTHLREPLAGRSAEAALDVWRQTWGCVKRWKLTRGRGKEGSANK